MDSEYKKKLEGLQRGAGEAPAQVQVPATPDTSYNDDAIARIRAAQLMALRNSPTAGMPAPQTAQDLKQSDDDFNSMMGELGPGVEVPVQPQVDPRFKRLFQK